MNNFWKTMVAITLLVAFYAAQNPKAIENIRREKAIYDSIGYCYEVTEEELKAMQADREFERQAKKGGKQND